MASYVFIANIPPRRGVRVLYDRLRGGDEIAYLVTLAAAVVTLLIVGLLVVELWINSTPTIKAFGWHFLTTSRWDPNAGQFGALPFIYGTCVTGFLGLLLAVPLGVASAIFLAEMAPPGISSRMLKNAS
ncbi:MAG: hypothetical protein M3Y57_07030 [Acidobacteriota bacterium]|nr:hypothetical protein [Acidobacteriota bacterium]